jgi:cytochrome c peroxidase
MHRHILKLLAIDAAVLIAAILTTAYSTTGASELAPRNDGWSAEEVNVLASMRLSQLPTQPVDPSNAVEALSAAAAFGKRLFNDHRFSQTQAVSCASCHDPQKQFQDGLPVGQGVGTGSRRAMPIVGTGFSPWLFWDGRKDSLWSQALGPLEDSVEHGGNRARYAHLIKSHYRAEYESIFQAMPDLSHVPPNASPKGTESEKTAWNALPSKAQADVSRIFSNMGKAIAAYEKTLSHGESRFDRYVEGVVRRDSARQESLTPKEVNGLRTFIGKGQCVSCHNGPLFTDQHFHNTGVPPRNSDRPDRGRAAALMAVQNDEFNCLGPFSDAKAEQCQELHFMVKSDPTLEGAFKTPSLRDVSLRPPYMHAGQLPSIEAVIRHYISAPVAAVGHSELAGTANKHSERKPIRLDEREIRDLAAFLATVSGPIVEKALK